MLVDREKIQGGFVNKAEQGERAVCDETYRYPGNDEATPEFFHWIKAGLKANYPGMAFYYAGILSQESVVVLIHDGREVAAFDIFEPVLTFQDLKNRIDDGLANPRNLHSRVTFGRWYLWMK